MVKERRKARPSDGSHPGRPSRSIAGDGGFFLVVPPREKFVLVD